jgi:DNA-binding NarL/FixJ family response regulator
MNIIIVGEDPQTNSTLKNKLEVFDCTVVGQFEESALAVEFAKNHSFDLAVIDLDSNGALDCI